MHAGRYPSNLLRADVFRRLHDDTGIKLVCLGYPAWHPTSPVGLDALFLLLPNNRLPDRLREIAETERREMLGFQRFEAAAVTISGIELAAKIR